MIRLRCIRRITICIDLFYTCTWNHAMFAQMIGHNWVLCLPAKHTIQVLCKWLCLTWLWMLCVSHCCQMVRVGLLVVINILDILAALGWLSHRPTMIIVRLHIGLHGLKLLDCLLCFIDHVLRSTFSLRIAHEAVPWTCSQCSPAAWFLHDYSLCKWACVWLFDALCYRADLSSSILGASTATYFAVSIEEFLCSYALLVRLLCKIFGCIAPNRNMIVFLLFKHRIITFHEISPAGLYDSSIRRHWL